MNYFFNSVIGKTACPIDNSQQYNLVTGEHGTLAGNSFGESPKLVTIISEPYKATYSFFGNKYTAEFVTVLYNGQPYVCLNQFHKNGEDAFSDHEDHLASLED